MKLVNLNIQILIDDEDVDKVTDLKFVESLVGKQAGKFNLFNLEVTDVFEVTEDQLEGEN